MFLHAGPAGSRFHSIEHAGRHMLKLNCNNYPMTTNSYILPPLFLTAFPEGRNPITSKLEGRIDPPLSGKEQKKFAGICSGQGGEQTEYKVFYLFTKLLEEEQDVPVLVLRDFELNTVGKGNLKLQTLKSEYPQITNIDMRGETDLIIILKDLGFIVIEVKRVLTTESLQKAQDQLDRCEAFLNDIIPSVAQNSYRLPILKLVIFELDERQDPLASNSPGYHYFNCGGDCVTVFKEKWKDLENELKSKLPASPFTPLEFKRLVRLLIGLWSMKSMNRQTYFDVNEASVTHLMTQIDVSVDHAHLSSDAIKTKKDPKKDPKYAPVTDVVYNQQGTVFREAKEINLMYLTPEQKNIYENVQRGVIRGAAGTGKTLLMLFKMIDIVQSHDNRKIILIIPKPHTLRCKKILEANGVRVVESEVFPPETETPYDVVVMSILHNCRSVLTNFSDQHIFIDEFQSHNQHQVVSKFTLLDVNLMRQAYEVASENNLHFWCMVDSLQQLSYANTEIKQFYSDLFSSACDSTAVPIPAYCLTNILRNTNEISNVVLVERDAIKRNHNLPFVDAKVSHNITSTLPRFHQLNDPYNYDVNVRVDFIVERLEEELRPLVGTTNPLPHSGIAMLYDNFLPSIRNIFFTRTREMLRIMFNIFPMSIEDQLKTDSATIAFDSVENATSAEWPVVIILANHTLSSISTYLGFSRARTRLIAIGINKLKFPSQTEYVRWRREEGIFVRVQDDPS